MSDVTIIGSGWGAVGFIKNSKSKNITVISPSPTFLYTPLLASAIRKNVNLEIDINFINDGVKYISGSVVDVNFDNNTLILDNGESIIYENVIFSHGGDVNTFNIKGVEENCYFIKSQQDVDKLREKLDSMKDMSKIAVIGTGVTGVEIIGNLMDMNKFKVSAIDGLKKPMSTFNEKTSNYVMNLWNKTKIDINMGDFVKNIDKDRINLHNSQPIEYDLAVWCGGVKNSKLTNKINSTLDLKGNMGIPVNSNLSIKSYTNAYAMGDCANSSHPKTAQVAYQQGEYLAKKFNGDNNNEEFKYNHKGMIAYVGKKQSVGEFNNFCEGGKLVGYMNTFVHVYNAASMELKLKIVKSKIN